MMDGDEDKVQSASHSGGNSDSAFDNLLYVAAAVCIFGSTAIGVMFFYTYWGDARILEITFAHARATLGLPAAAAGAFTVVAVFRASQGQIKFSIVGFNFEGASGPIVMWVLCFLAMTLGLKLLW